MSLDLSSNFVQPDVFGFILVWSYYKISIFVILKNMVIFTAQNTVLEKML